MKYEYAIYNLELEIKIIERHRICCHIKNADEKIQQYKAVIKLLQQHEEEK
jgi:hypothetical protein